MESAWKGISDSSRRKILVMLKEKEMTPTEISRHFQFTKPAVSVHLRILRNSDLIFEKKIGKNRIYSLNKEKALEMVNFFCSNVGLQSKKFKGIFREPKGCKKMK